MVPVAGSWRRYGPPPVPIAAALRLALPVPLRRREREHLRLHRHVEERWWVLAGLYQLGKDHLAEVLGRVALCQPFQLFSHLDRDNVAVPARPPKSVDDLCEGSGVLGQPSLLENWPRLAHEVLSGPCPERSPQC